MTKEEKYVYGCLFAINNIMEKGSSKYIIYNKDNGEFEKISWVEIKKWLKEQHAREVRDMDEN